MIDLTLDDNIKTPEDEEDKTLDAGLTNRVDKDQREIDLVKTSVRNNDNNLTLRNNDNIHDENLESTDEKCKTRNAQKQPTNFGIPTIFTIIHAETLKKNA
jgi:hypothetical protein